MKLGKVKLLPFFVPGDAGEDLDATIYALEELEEAAKLTLMCRGLSPNLLTDEQVSALVKKFDINF